MKKTTEWGRQETIVWPPHAPIYTMMTLGFGVLLTLSLCWLHLRFLQTPMQQTYAVPYVQSSIGALLKQRGKYRLVYVGGGRARVRLAVPADFTEGATDLPSGEKVLVQLSPASLREGHTTFFTGAEREYVDANLSRWMGQLYFNGGLLTTYRVPLFASLALLCMGLGIGVRSDVKRFKGLKYGRRLKGPVMMTPREFTVSQEDTVSLRTRYQRLLTYPMLILPTANRAMFQGRPSVAKFRPLLPSLMREPEANRVHGIGFTTNEKGAVLRIPQTAEAKHMQIMGDTGSGKSTLIKQLLQQIEDRGEVAIVYDPAGEFTERFMRKQRGDYILNPLDLRMPYWTPASELRTPAEARTIAASLYQSTEEKKNEFFTQTPQKIFAHLLKYKPSPEELVHWMSNEDEIDRRVQGTELAAMIAKGAQQQRNGVLGSLGLVADSLRLLPTKEQAKGREWCATDWAVERKGWIFLTSTEAEQEALRPLHSLWIDLLILRLLTKPKPGQKPVWLVIDELASLQRLPQFHTALTKGRKSANPIVFGYQGKAQLEVTYGHLAEVMLSQPSTKFILKTAEPKAAKWASELIGEVEIERVRETVADGKRQGKSFTLDRQVEPLVMSSEIEGLDDLHTFVKLGNSVSRFSFPHKDYPIIAPALIPRPIAEKDMWFDPLAPAEISTPSPAPETEAKMPVAPPIQAAPPTPAASATPAAPPTEAAPFQTTEIRPLPKDELRLAPALVIPPTPGPVQNRFGGL